MVRSRVFAAVASAAFALVLLRCSSFEEASTPSTEGGTDEAAAEASPTTDGGADASETSADAADAGDTGDTGDTGLQPTTCAELLAAGKMISGLYPFGNTQRYCDMTTAGGGWNQPPRS